MDRIKTAFLQVKEDMEKLRHEIEQIKDIQGVILDKIGVETTALDVEEMEEDFLDDEEVEDESDEDDPEEESQATEGNFIATKTGKRYHVLSCNLVKNIAEKNKMIFDSAEEAEEEGLLKCHCVKN